VAQSLEAFVSKCFALSFSISTVSVASANPIDHLLHRHTHRCVAEARAAGPRSTYARVPSHSRSHTGLRTQAAPSASRAQRSHYSPAHFPSPACVPGLAAHTLPHGPPCRPLSQGGPRLAARHWPP
jgi:hypothetical protein